MRYLVGAIVGCGVGAMILYGVPGTGFGGLDSSAYSTMVIYPAAVLAAAIVFLIVITALDQGSGA